MKMRKGAVTVKDLIILGLGALVLVVGIVCYTNYAKEKAEAERIASEKARAEQIERERLEKERQQKEEEEFERKKRDAKLAREREEEAREAARQAKEKAAREAEEERRRQLEEKESARRDYRSAQAAFAKQFQFVGAKDLPKLPFGGESKGAYWCVFSTYGEDHLIYKVMFTDGAVEVKVLSSDMLPRDMSATDFKSMYEPKRVAVTDGTTLWMKGVKMPGGLYDVPPRDKDFRILELQLGKLYGTFTALGMEAPKMDCRVTLKSDSGKTSSVLGVIDISDALEREKIEGAASAVIGKKLGKSLGAEATVKRKRVRRTVMKYDGRYIKKDMRGVTLVPRVYEFIGTTNYKSDDHRAENEFRKKWEALTAEADRQEKAEAEAEAEYRAACEAAKAKMDAKKREHAQIARSDSAIDAALSKCKLLVETRKSVAK